MQSGETGTIRSLLRCSLSSLHLNHLAISSIIYPFQLIMNRNRLSQPNQVRCARAVPRTAF